MVSGFLFPVYAGYAGPFTPDKERLETVFRSAVPVGFSHAQDHPSGVPGTGMAPAKTAGTAFLLALLGGGIGLHRLYLAEGGAGILLMLGYTCTAGGCGILLWMDQVLLLAEIAINGWDTPSRFAGCNKFIMAFCD